MSASGPSGPLVFVSLSKSLYTLLSTGSTQEDRKTDMTERLLTGM